MPLTFGSLFAGIGGIDLGLERAGMICKWQVEWDDYCVGELTKHWPNIPKYGDIKNVGKHNLEAVDCIAGGFPCQPVSLAGKRKAQADPRWLWSEFARVVDDLRPRYVLVENVPGLLLRGGNEVIADLAALGYDAEWDCIPASAFGAPHLRYRVFIISYRNGKRQLQPQRGEQNKRRRISDSSEEMAYPASERLEKAVGRTSERSGFASNNWWGVEPRLGELVDGLSHELAGRYIRLVKEWSCPNRANKLRALGNAVIPQVAEWIGRQIVRFDEENNANRI